MRVMVAALAALGGGMILAAFVVSMARGDGSGVPAGRGPARLSNRKQM
jgi:hypothetical protein